MWMTGLWTTTVGVLGDESGLGACWALREADVAADAYDDAPAAIDADAHDDDHDEVRKAALHLMVTVRTQPCDSR